MIKRRSSSPLLTHIHIHSISCQNIHTHRPGRKVNLTSRTIILSSHRRRLSPENCCEMIVLEKQTSYTLQFNSLLSTNGSNTREPDNFQECTGHWVLVWPTNTLKDLGSETNCQRSPLKEGSSHQSIPTMVVSVGQSIKKVNCPLH